MITKVSSTGLLGMTAYTIEVEADLTAGGLPRFDIVGLPDTAIKESRDRVSSAMRNCGYDFPLGKITINLAPADIKKAGPIYDVAMLIALLIATGQLKHDISNSIFLGELSLGGEVRTVNGVLPMVIHAKENNFKNIFVPANNALEAGVVEGINVYAIEHIKELVGFLLGSVALVPQAPPDFTNCDTDFMPDFSDVKGQLGARRAIEIAAAGGHNALLIGPPGSGKSMLAKRIPSILPNMTFQESIDTTKIYSIAGLLSRNSPLINARPFRSPHHTVSPAGLSGGGTIPHPGEISLAHNGVLFLDELPEFTRPAMEILRQPIEDGKVTISRVSGTLTYPCSIMLVAAMNPCPCGYFGHPTRPCTCSPNKVAKYLAKVSGPLLDRLDLHIDALPVDFDQISSVNKPQSSAEIKLRVDAARSIQNERFKDNSSINCNAQITPARLQQDCPISDTGVIMLKSGFEKLGLSARAYDRVLKVARTIADLDNSEIIESRHVAESIQYRSLDRKYWQR